MIQAEVLRQKDLSPGQDPMGESLLESPTPFKVWKPSHSGVVLGNSQKPELELNLPNVQADSIPIYKRKGGGGTVLLSPQGLCYGLRFKRTKDLAIHDYFEMGTSVLQNVLHKEFNLESKMRGISDLAVNDLKILGCSLYLPKGYALFLASVLIVNEKSAIEKYLSYPTREPDYREGRTHSEFITSIQDCLEQEQLTQIQTSGSTLQDFIQGRLIEEIQEEWQDSLFEF